MNGADILTETRHAFGTDRIFGMPGDGINAVRVAIRTRTDRIRLIQVRHEEAAAASAKLMTGRLGCCLATGPGGVHLLNGLYGAKLDREPVIAVTGSPHRDRTDTFTQQDFDHSKVFMDAAAYSTRLVGARHMGNAVSLAWGHAVGHGGVAHPSGPVDVPEEPVARPRIRPQHRGPCVAGPRRQRAVRARCGTPAVVLLAHDIGA